MFFSAVDQINSPDESSRGQKENTALFLWRGRHSSVSGRDTAAFLSIGMNNQEESQVNTHSFKKWLFTYKYYINLKKNTIRIAQDAYWSASLVLLGGAFISTLFIYTVTAVEMQNEELHAKYTLTMCVCAKVRVSPKMLFLTTAIISE